MRTAVMLFTRDLRVHDNPALAEACRAAEQVVPLFVVDPRLPAGPNRRRFLVESLADLRESLRQRGGDLVVRHGDPVPQAVRVAKAVGASGIFMAQDYSGYAAARQRRLSVACEQERVALSRWPGVTIVPPGDLLPSGGGDHYRVFTPYWRAWSAHRWRSPVAAPRRVTLPPKVAAGADPASLIGWRRGTSADVVRGGEREAERRLRTWSPDTYADDHDDLAADRTSRLSAYLHFGCVSPLTVAHESAASDDFVRQLCWRDFYHQVLAAFPTLTTQNYRATARNEWRYDDEALKAWQEGHTGVPVVDAGMRQLRAQGWLPNRARLITASYLTRTLGIDWRLGAEWYMRWLVDADVANNYGNWQWVAGTGNDTRPNRRFNPDRQHHRFDPDNTYTTRWTNTR